MPLAKRRLQCYRCFAIGHTRVNYRSEVDRSGGCFSCSKEDHTAVGCRAPPHCPVCTTRNLPADHRAGGEGCVPNNSPTRVTAIADMNGGDRVHDEHGESSATVPPPKDVLPMKEGMVIDPSNG